MFETMQSVVGKSTERIKKIIDQIRMKNVSDWSAKFGLNSRRRLSRAYNQSCRGCTSYKKKRVQTS